MVGGAKNDQFLEGAAPGEAESWLSSLMQGVLWGSELDENESQIAGV